MDKRAVQMERQRQRYYSAARSIVAKALRTYSTQFVKDIAKCNSIQQMQEVARKTLRTDEIENALRKIYYPVGKYFGNESYKKLKPESKAIKFTPNVGGLVRPTDLGGNPRSVIGLQGSINAAQAVSEDYWLSWVDKLVKGSLGQRITWITGTTKETFISVVDRIAAKGFEDGLSIDKIASSIMKDLKVTERYRAERIARTEVIGASNLSTQAGAQATGLALDKEWISFLDDNTRDSHRAINGTTIDMNEDFHLETGGILEVPGDPSGDAEDVINCRCTVGYKDKADSGYNWGREI